MIKNLPTYNEFEEVSKQCLTQAFNLLYKIYYNYNEYYDETIASEVSLDQIWEHNTGTLRTSIILLHQGIETYMKATICKTTPLLLIEKSRADWPTLPSKSDKDFNSLYTISGEALLSTFCAVSSIQITAEFVDFIETIRQRRNEAIHGANKISINAKELLESILKAYTLCFGIDAWFLETQKFNCRDPLFGYYDWDIEFSITYKYLDFALDILGRKKLKKHLSIDITSRPYYCAKCKNTIDGDVGDLESKWAFLAPNKPESTTLRCVNCSSLFDVVRKKCTEGKCEGNVVQIYDGDEICLTCFEYQYNEE